MAKQVEEAEAGGFKGSDVRSICQVGVESKAYESVLETDWNGGVGYVESEGGLMGRKARPGTSEVEDRGFGWGKGEAMVGAPGVA